MCLIALDFRPGFLRLASNRDEDFARPSQPAHLWMDKPHLFGGTDLEMGGTWLACSTSGRLAAITNYHSKTDDTDNKFPKSRGEISIQFCESTLSAKEFAEGLRQVEKDYGGFSVLLFDVKSLVCYSNRDPDHLVKDLSPGIYGLSNHLLDTPWPKVEQVKIALANLPSEMTNSDATKILLEEFQKARAAEDPIPTTMEEIEEELRSAIFVGLPTLGYGTRTTTIITFQEGIGFDVTEQNHKTPHSEPSLSHKRVECVRKT
jgi:uncharacterized protein with NRDE domain